MCVCMLRCFSSVQFSPSVVSDSLRPHGLQHTRPPCPSPISLLQLMSIDSVMPSNHLVLCCPLLLPPSIFPSIRVFSNESDLRMRCQSIGVSALASVLPMNTQDWSPLMDWLDLLAVQGTQESSPTPQFKSISSLELSFLYSPTLTSIHDCWKNRSLD